MEFLALVAVVALCAAMAWLARRIEPHVVSKDGRTFLCMGQLMTLQGAHVGPAHETRVLIKPDGQLQVEQKRFLRRTTTFWRAEARAPEAPKRKAVFLLRGHDEAGSPVLLALRMPATSRAVATMEELVRPAHGSSDVSSSSTSPGG